MNTGVVQVWIQVWLETYLIVEAGGDMCRDLHFVVVHVTGVCTFRVEANTGDITWSQVSEYLMSKPIQVTSRDHRWVNSLVVKMMTSSCSPRLTHTSPVRSVSSSMFCMKSLELRLSPTTLALPRPAAAAVATLEPASCSSLIWPLTVCA